MVAAADTDTPTCGPVQTRRTADVKDLGPNIQPASQEECAKILLRKIRPICTAFHDLPEFPAMAWKSILYPLGYVRA